MLRAEGRDTKIWFDEETLRFGMERQGSRWDWRKEYRPRMRTREGEFDFQDALRIRHEFRRFGLGEGIRSRYEGFRTEEGAQDYCFETFVWVEASTGNIFFEWIPLKETGIHVETVYWPGEMEFDRPRADWYTLLTHQQGLLIPNTWETALSRPAFDGFFETAGGYMPWFGQVRGREGYLAICVTPWDGGYQAEHPAGGPFTHVGIRFEPSLGKMDYRRIVRYTLLPDCDYNDLCREYRQYVDEQGNLRTLREKAARNPSVERLAGCMFVHKGIKNVVQPDSEFFDPQNPEKYSRLVPFSRREEEIRKFRRMGVENLYLHLDGWGQPGYDNQHPDYLPACREAGGWEGMKSLVDTVHECGYLFGVHDQYRDYYLAAPGYEEELACHLPDGTVPGHRRWAGGPQTYLCASQAPYFVRRNFMELERQGIRLDGAYLDVFTCNEGDECASPEHRMSRRECYEFRGACFEYLLSRGILTSSEEVSDWAVPSLVFCHYAPYDFMMRRPGSPKEGIPVPLYNLVYHDCVIQPWMMEKVSEEEDYMFYALLNGGAPYLVRDGAYPDTDGSFSGGVALTEAEHLERCRKVAALHKKVAFCRMERHELLEEDGTVQSTLFSDGTRVTVDLKRQLCRIEGEKAC